MQPVVSVITVTYNSSPYVRDAIESVLASGYTDFEYIIGDDCSADGTWEIIGGYRDKRIVAYRNEQNLGEYPNRNKAISLAKGTFLLFVDGDDMLLPHGLEQMVRMMQAFPGAAFGCEGYQHQFLIYPIALSPEEAYRFQFLGKGFFNYSLAGTIFRTDTLKSEGGLSEAYISGDYEVRLRLAQKYPCLILTGGAVWARATPGQASERAASLAGYLETFRINERFLNSDLSPLSGDEKKQALINLRIPMLRAYFKCLLSLDLAGARRIWSVMNPYGFLSLLAQKTDWSYGSRYNHLNPKRMPFSENPYSAQYQKKNNLADQHVANGLKE